MNTKKYLILPVLLILFSCNKDNTIVYDSNSDYDVVFFERLTVTTYNALGQEESKAYTDSSSVSLAGIKDLNGTYKYQFNVFLMGNMADYDRKIDFEVDKELTTAIEGVDFEINYDTTYLKANSVSTSIFINLIKSERLYNEKVRLAIRLKENEFFKLQMSEMHSLKPSSNSTSKISSIVFKVNYDAIQAAPEKWEDYKESHFGEWSAKKFNLLNELMNWEEKDWRNIGITGNKIQPGMMNYTAFKIKGYLQDLADNNIPLKEDNGEFMQLADDFRVDYSAFE